MLKQAAAVGVDVCTLCTFCLTAEAQGLNSVPVMAFPQMPQDAWPTSFVYVGENTLEILQDQPWEFTFRVVMLKTLGSNVLH